jgi:hypothetical protein
MLVEAAWVAIMEKSLKMTTSRRMKMTTLTPD